MRGVGVWGGDGEVGDVGKVRDVGEGGGSILG